MLIIGALAIWGALLYVSANSYSTVTGFVRHMDKPMTDIYERDCYIKAVTAQDKIVSGYGPSSYCASLKVGDKVKIENGVVEKR